LISLATEAKAVLSFHDVDPGPFHLTLARNVAARRSTGEILAFVDADIVLDPETVRRAIPLVLNGHAVVVYASYMQNFIDPKVYEVTDAYSFRENARLGDVHLDGYGGCFFVSREVFEAIGGYDEEFVGWGAEDADIVDRLNAHGARVLSLSALEGIVCIHQYHGVSSDGRHNQAAANRRHYLSTTTIVRNPRGWGGEG
jgi:predicted glycosyltransferase involved in capsule biosynthesis